MTATRWLPKVAIGLAVLIVLAFAVGSLGRPRAADIGNSSTTQSDVSGRGLAGGQVKELSTVDSAGPLGAPSTRSVLPATPPFGDRIARTADISVEVKDGVFDQVWGQAHAIATRFGGQVMTATRGQPSPIPLYEDSAARDGRDRSGDITMRIPSARFEAALSEMRALGKVRADTIAAEDVTQEFVDLNSRLRHLRAEERVLLSLFNRAKTVGDALQVQNRLGEIQGQIEEVTGRIRYLDARTSFSTVSLHLAEPGAIVPAPGGDEPSFAHAWETAIEGLVRIGSASLILAFWLAPFALLALLGWSIRRRARKPAPQV